MDFFFFVYSSHHNYHNSNASVIFNIVFLTTFGKAQKKDYLKKFLSYGGQEKCEAIVYLLAF